MQKNTIATLIVIGLIAAGFGIYFSVKNRQFQQIQSAPPATEQRQFQAPTQESPALPPPLPEEIPILTKPSIKQRKPEKPIIVDLHAGMSYGEAINTMHYRLQFLNCNGIVGSAINVGTLSLKKGASFMIDNRDSGPRVFAFAGHTVRVGPYDFAIVTAQKIGAYPITCDGGGGAVLNVEK